MTCVEIRERLDSYADGEEPAPGEVESHLRGCPTCEAAFSELRAQLASLDAALGPVAVVAEAAAARALAGLPPDHAARAAGVPWWGLPLAAAAGFLVAVTFVKGSVEWRVPGVPRPPERGEAVERERAELAAKVDLLLRTPEVGCQVEGADQKLKKLGTSCVEPAAAWVKKADVEKDAFNRRVAARVVADLATTAQVDLLLDLVGDADPQVRMLANGGLMRISGMTACPDAVVKESPEKAREAWAKKLGAK